MATITFKDGSSIVVDANQTVAQARRALTPPDKKYAHLSVYSEKEGELHGGYMLGERILQGVWQRVHRPPLSWSPIEDPHLWEEAILDGHATNVFTRITTNDFHLSIVFEGNVIFSKMISRHLACKEGYDPGIELRLAVLQLDPPCPGPSCHRDWAQLYLDRVWVSRDVEFWAKPRDCLFSCGVGPGTSLTAFMERLDLNHPAPEGDTEERRARIRAKLKRKRDLRYESESNRDVDDESENNRRLM